MATKTQLVLRDDGRTFRQCIDETEVTVDLANYLKRSALDGLAFLTPDLGPVPAIRALQTRFLFCPGHSGGEATVGFMLDGLNFHTSFELTDDRLTPKFDPSGAQIDPAAAGILRHQFMGFNPWFVVTLTSYGDSLASLAGFTRTTEDGAARKRLATLPLPNVFDDGKLCLGDGNGRTDPDDPILRRAEQVLGAWLKAPWNQDLYGPEKERACQTLFSWTPEGTQVHPGPQAWWDLCPAVSPGQHPSATKFFSELAAERGAE